MTIITDPQQIEAARLLTLRQALKLEIKGMKRSGRSAYSILKDMGYSGTRQKVLDQLDTARDKILQKPQTVV